MTYKKTRFGGKGYRPANIHPDLIKSGSLISLWTGEKVYVIPKNSDMDCRWNGLDCYFRNRKIACPNCQSYRRCIIFIPSNVFTV